MITLIILTFVSFAFLAFGLWMSANAKTGAQSTAGNVFILLGTVAALILLALAIPAHAHDHSRPGLDGWFKSLRSKSDVPCCDGSDAMRLEEVDWETKDGHYRVRLEGEWVDVPDNAVIEKPNLAGPTMVWPYYKDGAMRGVRCFLPGTMI